MNDPAVGNRQLDPLKIIETVAVLQQRILERFPDSGLGRVVGQLHQVAGDCAARVEWIKTPRLGIRLAVGVLIAGLIGVLVAGVASLEQFRVHQYVEFVEALEATIKNLVFIAGAIVFLLTWESRLKRTRALRALHELRALAHTVDMHQLTKDPDRHFRLGNDTPSSPRRKMTPFELNRYLDYCSETLALISKVAAIYGQSFDDPVLLAAVDDVESLTANLSRMIWQKITILDRLIEQSALAKAGDLLPVK